MDLGKEGGALASGSCLSNKRQIFLRPSAGTDLPLRQLRLCVHESVCVPFQGPAPELCWLGGQKSSISSVNLPKQHEGMGALEHRDGSLWPDQSTSFAACCSIPFSPQQVKSYPWIFIQGASVVVCAVHIFGQLNVSVEKLQVTAAQDPGSVQGFFFLPYLQLSSSGATNNLSPR